MIKTRSVKPGIKNYALDLKQLFDDIELVKFEKKWTEFFESDALNPKIFQKQDNTLHYLCDHFVPEITDKRTPLFMLFGNSAPHSITEECYFSYEGNRREHRMWKLLEELELFRSSHWLVLPIEQRNILRKAAWFDLSYDSPFKLAMDVFLSIPSTPSKPPWSGVAGTQKLLGSNAIKKLTEFEQERLHETIGNFLNDKGFILAFQKDAYNGVVTANSKQYDLQNAIDGNLVGEYLYNPKIKVYGIAPTRWLNGGKARESLKNLIKGLK